ncbi:uncharacterized protein A4U43_C05F25130 [Asparagus officinalis]|uniref:Uncharacterized protein n=1 Tax=Asparagus officinalis TaxID=4686 RepID=A0A5P1EV15_ASPOF|nr:uncharacterized protein A4U43_C05F25130 [Asparagus officinalis]
MDNVIRPRSASNADCEGSGDSWLSNPSGMERRREDYLCGVGRFQRSSSQRKEGAAANAVALALFSSPYIFFFVRATA